MTGFGDDFSAIYRVWAPRIFNHFRRLAWDPDDASDLTAEVFATAWDKREQLHDCERVGGWLWTIAGRLAANRVRSDKRRQARHETVAVSVSNDSGSAATTRQCLSRAFSALDDKDRQLLLWREHSGLSYAEISELTGQTVESVRSALYRARERLRTEFHKRWE